MEINKELTGSILNIILVGRLDTTTAPELDNVINNELNDITELNFDFKDLDYISSAGLRVLLQAQKIMNNRGKLTIKNVNEDVMDVFEMTGFADILTII